MVANPWPASLKGYRVHLVGIKGTGMAALAEILHHRGALLSGSDGPERFYTDALLQRLGIPYRERFAAENIEPGIRLVIHSAAYNPAENVELKAAAERGIPLLSYPQALGELSAGADSSGVAGTHGKTTTTALAGVLLGALDLPVTVLAGSEVAGFGGRCTLIRGERYFVAETCEYRRHFLHFHPQRLVLTGVEPDHLDYFRDLEDVLDAFTGYALLLPPKGSLIFCHDDAGARQVVERLRRSRADLRLLPYGLSAPGPFRLERLSTGAGATRFGLAGLPGEFLLPLPGRHLAADAAAALALAVELARREGREARGEDLERMRQALAGFRGSRRRSEVVGEARGVLFVDDYGHHPTEIRATLEGLRSFYPGRRLLVDFMPHTYSRTAALLDDFARCFESADQVILHRIYASAREQAGGQVDGRTLFREVSRRHPAVRYFEEPLDCVGPLAGELREGDLFVTMGAGDNWKVGRELLRQLGGTA
jgi:UDP-N-acetylmuramate--alanine ligase